MRKFIMQLHITQECNKKCKHCYQHSYLQKGLPINKLKSIIDEFVILVKEYSDSKGARFSGQVNITGGEPFVREDIWELLNYIKEVNLSFAILSNGSLFTNDLVKRLKDYKPVFVQVSIEGSKKTNDDIRGEGSYEETERAVKLLKKHDIYSLVSFTASNLNYREFPEAVKFAKKAKASKVWTDRYVQTYGEESEIRSLNKEELREYVRIIKTEELKANPKVIKIAGDRSLQFLNGESKSYSCGAGKNLIIVTESGNVMMCRRLDIVAGNLNEKSMSEIYFNSEEFKKVREKYVPKGCEKCGFINLCNGGAKCISYGIYRDYTEGDFSCPLKQIKASREI
ncbi:MAG: radical SAM/SPASM domain-containing protein [Sarcina sp.]